MIQTVWLIKGLYNNSLRCFWVLGIVYEILKIRFFYCLKFKVCVAIWRQTFFTFQGWVCNFQSHYDLIWHIGRQPCFWTNILGLNPGRSNKCQIKSYYPKKGCSYLNQSWGYHDPNCFVVSGSFPAVAKF